ncbi:hypothetical protein [Methylobacterium sp.]|uniref:hypothetical protein n=1 Tax=Methylobacterium sp. TaxID=409 RepID=UPI003B0097D1
MSSIPEAPVEFWDGVPALVTAKVRPALNGHARDRQSLVEYLRDLETVARHECGSRETVQVIASGRRLLGDRTEIASGDGPFSRT